VKFLLPFIYLLAAFIHIPDETNIIGDNKKIVFKKSDTILLKEEKQPFRAVLDVVKNNNHLFATTFNASLVIEYDLEGNQKSIISKNGRGPFEYLRPDELRLTGDTLSVWDSSLLKLLRFDSTGSPISEISGIKQALQDYIIVGDYFIRYKPGGFDKNIISVHKIEGTTFKQKNQFGNSSDQHEKLLRYAGTAPLASKDNIIYFGEADKTVIHSYDLESGEEKSIRFFDKNFKVDESNFLTRERNREADYKWRSFIFTNSRFKSIYTLDKFIIAEIQNGNNFTGTRETLFHIFNYDLEELDVIRLSHQNMFELGNGAIYASGNEILFYNDYPDKTNNSGKLIDGLQAKEPENYLRKITIFQIEEIK